MSARSPTPAPGASPGGPAAHALALLARAAQRVRAYPGGSPLATHAVDAAHGALSTLDREAIFLRVTPKGIVLDDGLVTGIPAVSELAARLHQASIGTVSIAREGSARDLSVFGRELAGHHAVGAGQASTLADMLQERGVERITVTTFETPTLFELADPEIDRLVDAAPRAPDTGVGGYLYPPGKGWVRLDPATAVDHLTLHDLASLVADPFLLAEMLGRLSGEPPAANPEDALAARFEDITRLFRGAHPAVAERLLAGLARAVLALEPERRADLFRHTILPGLLDGRVDGTVLRHLPDVQLAESLALLHDLQLAAPELLALALERLELGDERAARLQPMVAEQIAVRRADGDARPGVIDGYQDGRIRVDHLAGEKEFADYASFNLAIDAAAEAEIARVRDAVATTAGTDERLRCLGHLVRLQANPATAGWLLTHVRAELAELRRQESWNAIATWVAEFGALHAHVSAARPEVGELVRQVLEAVLDEPLVLEMLRLAERDRDAATPARLFLGAGPSLTGPLARVLAGSRRPPTPVMVQALSPHAAALVPALTPLLDHDSPAVVRAILAVLACAGTGVEPWLASALGHADPTVVADACRALVQVGTPEAVRAVSARLASGDGPGALFLDTLGQFSAPLRAGEVRRLLADRQFISRAPRLARALIAMAAGDPRAAIAPVLSDLARWRFHFWRPSRALVGLAAARAGARLG